MSLRCSNNSMDSHARIILKSYRQGLYISSFRGLDFSRPDSGLHNRSRSLRLFSSSLIAHPPEVARAAEHRRFHFRLCGPDATSYTKLVSIFLVTRDLIRGDLHR
jgi:hypothetical protein